MKTISVIPFEQGIKDTHHRITEEFQRLLLSTASLSAWCMDLGTGEGQVAFALAPYVRWVLGVDKNPRLIEEARRIAQNDGVTNVQFIVGNLEEMRYPDLAPIGSFQLVSTHLFLTNEVISMVPSAMSPKGHFVGTCFEKHHWHETGSEMDMSYTDIELSELLLQAGFIVKSIDVIGRVIKFEMIEQIEKEFLPPRIVNSWKESGRWDELSSRFQAGKRTLTESKLVFDAEFPE